MKITLTHAELLALVKDRFSLPDNAELEISEYSGMDHPNAIRIMSILTQNDCLTPSGGIRPDKKIMSIKLLRDLVAQSFGQTNGTNSCGVYCGLAQAKFAIEDWDNFLIFVRKNGFPRMGHQDPERGWLMFRP